MVREDGLVEILGVWKYAEMRGLDGVNLGALQSIGYKEFS